MTATDNILSDLEQRLLTEAKEQLKKCLADIDEAQEKLTIAKEKYKRYLQIVSIYEPKKYDVVFSRNFPTFLKGLFSDGRPRTSQEIREVYLLHSGKDINTRDFSSKLNVVKQNSKQVKIINKAYSHLPMDKRYWWGLAEWLDNKGDFKPEYKSKIPIPLP